MNVKSFMNSTRHGLIAEHREDAVKGIVKGVIFTLILLTVIPYFFDTYVCEIVGYLIGDANMLFLSSRFLVDLIMWIMLVKIGDMLGAEKLMDDYGVFGIAGLFFAYWIAGDWTEAIIPVITIIPAKFGLVS